MLFNANLALRNDSRHDYRKTAAVMISKLFITALEKRDKIVFCNEELKLRGRIGKLLK